MFWILTFQNRSKHFDRFVTWRIRVLMISWSTDYAFYLFYLSSYYHFFISSIGEVLSKFSIFSDLLSKFILKKLPSLFWIYFSRLCLIRSLRQNWISPLSSCRSKSSSSKDFHLRTCTCPESRRNRKLVTIYLSQCSEIVCIFWRAEKLIFILDLIKLYLIKTFLITWWRTILSISSGVNDF